MTEIWKELEGFSNYKFSNSGKVWSKKYNIEMSLNTKTDDGYIRIQLRNDDGKPQNYFVHRLVALTFIPNPETRIWARPSRT